MIERQTIHFYIWDTCTVHVVASLSAGYPRSYHKKKARAVRVQACMMIYEKVGVSYHNDG